MFALHTVTSFGSKSVTYFDDLRDAQNALMFAMINGDRAYIVTNTKDN